MNQTTARPRPKHFVLSSLAIATLMLAGCAVLPQPLTASERAEGVSADRAALFAVQEPVKGDIALQEVMARALKYNLDYRVKLMEEALAQRQLDLSNLDLLPKLALGAGYNQRDSDAASSSQDVLTGKQSLVPSISSERTRINADLGLTWNVLDFGVSYYGAQQQADRRLIMQERKRKVAHQLLQQARQAYWQAVGAQRLEPKISALLLEAEAALADARKVEQEKLRSPQESLGYQRQLLDVIRQMTQIRNALVQAKPRLAAIMNLSPGQRFSVVEPALLDKPKLGLSLERMEEMALGNRPEVIEARYNERIGVLETKKAVAKLLPGVELSLGAHYDDNKFLVNQGWGDAGLRVSWNLLNVLNAKTIRGSADAQLQLAREQRMALNMAVLTQVHVAWLDYQGRERQFALEQDMYAVERRLQEYSNNAALSNAQGKLPAILASANAVLSELRLYQGYGDLQNAYGQIAATIGLDPLPAAVSSHDVSVLGSELDNVSRYVEQTLAGGSI